MAKWLDLIEPPITIQKQKEVGKAINPSKVQRIRHLIFNMPIEHITKQRRS
jgi:hypothetical protein